MNSSLLRCIWCSFFSQLFGNPESSTFPTFSEEKVISFYQCKATSKKTSPIFIALSVHNYVLSKYANELQVPPAELEDLLRTVPDVADVAVIGIPHERFGEAPRAYIVKKPGSTLSEQDIVKFVAENAAAYKHLVGGVEFIAAIPKSNSGKILRKELKADFKGST